MKQNMQTEAAKLKQVADQCRVIAHMGKALTELHNDLAKLFDGGRAPAGELADGIGRRTAAWMEVLGDMLSGIDAVTEEDEWTDPIFKEAQRMFPGAEA
jgi:hypothetical protein